MQLLRDGGSVFNIKVTCTHACRRTTHAVNNCQQLPISKRRHVWTPETNKFDNKRPFVPAKRHDFHGTTTRNESHVTKIDKSMGWISCCWCLSIYHEVSQNMTKTVHKTVHWRSQFQIIEYEKNCVPSALLIDTETTMAKGGKDGKGGKKKASPPVLAPMVKAKVKPAQATARSPAPNSPAAPSGTSPTVTTGATVSPQQLDPKLAISNKNSNVEKAKQFFDVAFIGKCQNAFGRAKRLGWTVAEDGSFKDLALCLLNFDLAHLDLEEKDLGFEFTEDRVYHMYHRYLLFSEMEEVLHSGSSFRWKVSTFDGYAAKLVQSAQAEANELINKRVALDVDITKFQETLSTIHMVVTIQYQHPDAGRCNFEIRPYWKDYQKMVDIVTTWVGFAGKDGSPDIFVDKIDGGYRYIGFEFPATVDDMKQFILDKLGEGFLKDLIDAHLQVLNKINKYGFGIAGPKPNDDLVFEWWYGKEKAAHEAVLREAEEAANDEVEGDESNTDGDNAGDDEGTVDNEGGRPSKRSRFA